MRSIPSPSPARCGAVRPFFLLVLALVVGAPLFFLTLSGGDAEATGSVGAERGRVVVIGIDGGDFRTLARYADEGRAPNFSRLRESGTFAPLESIAPPESPTAWAALNSGQNPAKTGVPSFFQRELLDGNPMPNLGLAQPRSGTQGRPFNELSHAPLPAWSEGTYRAVGGAVGFVLGLVLFGLLLGRRGTVGKLAALVLALATGAAGALGGQTARGWMPEFFPYTANPMDAPAFWDLAGDQGLRVVALQAAQAWDTPSSDNTRLLAGFGVPDARGGFGDWFIYTTEDIEFDRLEGGARQGRRTPTAGSVIRVDAYQGNIQTRLLGPVDFYRQDVVRRRIEAADARLNDPSTRYQESLDIQRQLTELRREERDLRDERTSAPMQIEVLSESARVTIDGQTQELREGQWSDWYRVRFRMNPLLSVHAITRVKLQSLSDPHFEMFVSRMDIDPARPSFWQPISSPHEFASALARQHGPFETYGWSTLTMPFKDKMIGPETLMEDVEFTLKWREELILAALQREDWDVFLGVFSTPDRVQHMMYQYYDEGHPLYVAEEAAREIQVFGRSIRLDEAIPAIYAEADRVMGRVIDSLRPTDTLLVVSDHGFQSFRWQVNINNWLAENGFLALSQTLASTSDGGIMSRYIDWSNTRAYSMGLGGIYLNLAGREGRGIVTAEEAPAVLAELREKLLAAVDPRTGDRLCTQVIVVADERQGPHLSREPDLLPGFAPTYRVSWRTGSGGIQLVEETETYEEGETTRIVLGEVVVPNDSPWSGCHVSVDTREVMGLFLSNRPFELPEDRPPHLLQVAPTVLALLGLAVPEAMDMPPLPLAR